MKKLLSRIFAGAGDTQRVPVADEEGARTLLTLERGRQCIHKIQESSYGMEEEAIMLAIKSVLRRMEPECAEDLKKEMLKNPNRTPLGNILKKLMVEGGPHPS